MIRAWRYDAERSALTITFVNGKAYVYQDVPADIAEGMRLASPRASTSTRPSEIA